MAKKSNSKLPGCIYKKRGRYYWKVKLPGEAEVKARPLVPTGGRYATKDKGVAVCVAEQIWTNAVFHSDASINVPGDGSIASLVLTYLPCPCRCLLPTFRWYSHEVASID